MVGPSLSPSEIRESVGEVGASGRAADVQGTGVVHDKVTLLS